MLCPYGYAEKVLPFLHASSILDPVPFLFAPFPLPLGLRWNAS